MKTIKQILLLVFLVSISDFSPAQWTITPGPATQYGNTLYNIGNVIYAGTDAGAYRSTDNGNSWTQINNGFGTTRKVYDFYYSGDKVWCATVGSGLYFSTNNGNNWIREYGAFFNNTYSAVASNQFTLASSGSYVYYSTNNGTNWVIMSGGTEPWGDRGLIVNASFVYAGDRSGVYISALGQTSWTRVNGNLTGNSTFVRKLRYVNDKMYIATRAGIWSSTNSGTNWTNLNTALSVTDLLSLYVNNSNIFIGTANKMYLSKDDGTSWNEITNGLPSTPSVPITDITLNNSYAFVMLENGFVYRRPLSDLGIVGIQNISSQVPDNFNLSQNYPNPFNPTTNINFTVPNSGYVKMIVYDINGREISTLVNQEMTPGSYKVDFDGSNLSSGFYYCTMTGGDFVETKKMMLVK